MLRGYYQARSSSVGFIFIATFSCVLVELNVTVELKILCFTVGGAKNNQSKSARWPWIVVTVAMCALDLVATVSYANDSFQTRVGKFSNLFFLL